PLHAQDRVPAQAHDSVLDAALATTKARGAATVAVFTSADQPASVRFWSEFYHGDWARKNRGLVQVVNIAKDDHPDLVRAMDVTRFPTVVIYTRGPRGVAKLGTITDCNSAEEMVGWLRALDTEARPARQVDVSVTPALYGGGDVYPSQQYPYPPASQPTPQLQAQPQPQPVPMMATAP